MSIDAKPITRLISLFTEQPCWMIAPLATELRYSVPSVRRFLAQAGYFSSFTHNSGWYTLRSIPQFDGDGLWFHRGIGFSRTGTLTNTIIALVRNSAVGMSAEELGDKLRCRCHSILVQLCRGRKLQRQKQGRCHRYLAADAPTAAAQSLAGLPVEHLPAEIAVFVLAEYIRNPQSGFKQLAAALAHSKGVTIEAAQIERLFAQHGLKKTASAAPRHYRH